MIMLVTVWFGAGCVMPGRFGGLVAQFVSGLSMAPYHASRIIEIRKYTVA
jgi:hypothetical protein